MPLQPETDVATADWFARSDAPWTQLCSLGPSGFERYCRLLHPLHEGAVADDPEELLNVEGHLDATHLRRLTSVLSRYTSTPDDCLFGLWDGFGDLPGDMLTGPRVQIPRRSYLLFRGSLSDAGQWGVDLAPGRPRSINSPNLIWPSDRAWFVASEIDLPWTGVAGESALVEELLADAVLDVQPVSLGSQVPYGRH